MRDAIDYAGSEMSATLPMTMGERLALAKLEARIAGTEPPEIVVGSRYVVIALVGGDVVRAHDRALDRVVALKRLRADPNGVRTSGVLTPVAHPHVVSVLDVVEDPLGVFVVREWIDGVDLRGWLAARTPAWPVVVDTMIGAARGLAAVHTAGLVHGNPTPDNVLVGSDGSARIVDFALGLRGTPGYLAPEQYADAPADAKSDQLAFCLTLFEALYSARAIDAELAARLRVDPFAWSLRDPPRDAHVPKRIHAVIARGAGREPGERYPTMDALIDALVDAGRRDRVGRGLATYVAELRRRIVRLVSGVE